VSRYLLSIVSLAGLIFWLVFSYLSPGLRPFAPSATQATWLRPLLPWVALVCLILFVAIQLQVLWSTQRIRQWIAANVTEEGHKLNVAVELFWTALPLLMTLGLAALSYPTWRSLFAP
jgi:heme/copper-type cytochrome/quinol oxidase subunit 2